jgi:RNA polymerase sigma-70 factor (ECF subfamily)
VTQTSNIGIDENVLLRRSAAGDSAATQMLILKYQNRIYNVILKICANPDDAAELTQDTFVKVIENINSFKAKSSFYTWVFRIAVNLTLNHCKRKNRLQLRPFDDENDDYGHRAKGALRQILADDSIPDPAVVAQNSELCHLILKALAQLDDMHRTVIVLRDIEDMNYARIADILDVEVGTVKSRLSRARNNLREIMETFLK